MKNPVFYEVIDSTNDEAIRRAKSGENEAVIIARRQTSGRGRQGKSWESPEGNLHISFLLRPSLRVEQASHITLVAGVAVYKTVLPLTPPSLPQREKGGLTIKWPNDIYWKGKKLAGILTESSSAGDPEKKVDWVVCGIGINVNSDPLTFSPEIRNISTSLKVLTGNDFSLEDLAAKLTKQFEREYEIFCREGPDSFQTFAEEHA